MITKEQVIEATKQCFDPEIPVNIWDLGLIYDIGLDEPKNTVNIRMTLTSQHCPAAKTIPDDVRAKIQKLGVQDVNIDVVFDPPWTAERISEDGKKKLGIED
jgi:metal-sulfur cluster biosynthetic enzyme